MPKKYDRLVTQLKKEKRKRKIGNVYALAHYILNKKKKRGKHGA